MYVIKRTDKEYGKFTVIHKTLDDARIEANRLAARHAQDNAEFTIYELKKVKTISSEIAILELSWHGEAELNEPCETCGGSKRIICPRCRDLQTALERQNVPCPRCKTTGFVPCPDCKGKKQ